MKITATSVKVQSAMLLVLKRNTIFLIGTVRLMVPKMALLQNDRGLLKSLDIMYISNI